MKNILLLFCYMLFNLILSSCSKSGGAKGTVIDGFTNLPISGVEVKAEATSDIQEEQKYLKLSTKTDKNGEFKINGLPNKEYSIEVFKSGYTSAKSSVDMPEKSSTRLIQKPIELWRLPVDSRGNPQEGVVLLRKNYHDREDVYAPCKTNPGNSLLRQ